MQIELAWLKKFFMALINHYNYVLYNYTLETAWQVADYLDNASITHKEFEYLYQSTSIKN